MTESPSKRAARKSPAAPEKMPKPVRRGPGRPSSSEGQSIGKPAIIRTAYRLAARTPLQDLSIVLVAKTMGVTPALIHYYIGSRDLLTSGVMNLFYKNLLRRWPAETDDWEHDVRAVARSIYGELVKCRGVASYVVLNNRFRIFQLTEKGERDHGVETLERFIGIVARAGLTGERTGIYAHLLLEFIQSSAYGAISHRYPGEHRAFLEDATGNLDPRQFPNIHFARGSPLSLDAEAAFDEGCRLFLLGLKEG